jgi:exonuclease SbcC
MKYGLLARSAGDDAAWLAARGALAPEVAAWPELDARFAQHDALGEAIAELDRALGEHVETKGKLERARKPIADDLSRANHKHEEAKRKAASYSQKRGVTLDAARRLEDEARTRLGEVERLVAIAAEARVQVQATGEIDRRRAELAAAMAGDAMERSRLLEAQRIAYAVRAEKAQVVEDLRRTAGYAYERAKLVSGDPCPLCGATEHPWRDRGALDDVIAGAEERLAATVAELDTIATQLAEIAAREQHHEREHARHARERTARAASAEAAVATWRDHLGALGELLLVEDPASPAAEDLAADRATLAKKKLEDARMTRSQAEAAAKAAQDAQAEVQLCQVAVDQLAVKLAEHDKRLADLEATIGRFRGERTSKLDQHAGLASEMAAAMARWTVALPATSDEPPPGAGSTAGTVARPSGRAPMGNVVAFPSGRTAETERSPEPRATPEAPDQRSEGSAKSNVRGGRMKYGPLASVVTPPPGRAGGNVLAFPSRRTSTAGVTDPPTSYDRASPMDPALALALVARLQANAPPRHTSDVLPDSPLAIVRLAMAAVVAAWRERAERIAHADAALSAAAVAIEREARDSDRAVAEHTARRDAAERRCEALRRELAEAVARLDAACSAAGFASDELRRLWSADPSHIDVLAERVTARERAALRTRVVVTERERQVAEHAATCPVINPVTDLASDATGAPDRHDDAANAERLAVTGPRAVQLAAASVDALAAAVIDAERRAAQLAATLAADADARARRAAHFADLAAEETSAEVDRILGEVIGSHDGKLFRSFAQSLTLDSLLAVANAHLEELAPRYQLERVPRHDLELQVIDRDLGSEVRSVQSLSGGESFLVSLALALGLSSMSAHDVRVRTLLIDEGFGTLDPATLDSALSMLDALQATGRQVGVISHVPALVERVGAHVRVVSRGGGRSEVIVA